MNLEQAARFVLRTVESDDTLGEYDHAIACLRAAVLQLDLYAVTTERDMLQERAEKAAERLGYDKEQLQSLYNQAREELRLSRAAQRDAQNGYIPIIRDSGDYAAERLGSTQPLQGGSL